MDTTRKTDPLEDLRTLVLTLSKQELTLCRKMLVASSGRKENKCLDFLNLINEDKHKSRSEAEFGSILYPESKSAVQSLRFLKGKLRVRLLDILISEVNLIHKDKADEKCMARIEVRKKMSHFNFVFCTMNNPKLADLLLDDIIQISKRNELYGILSEVYYFKYIHAIRGGRTQNAKDFERQFRKYMFCANASQEAGIREYNISHARNFKSSFFVEEDKSLFKNYQATYKIKETKSENIASLALKDKFYSLINKQEYIEAQKVSIDRFNLISHSKTLKTRGTCARINNERGLIEILLGNYSSGILFVNEALKDVMKDTQCYFFSYEIKFFCLYLQGKYTLALDCTNNLLNADEPTEGKFRIAKYHFYHANAHFALGNYRDSLKALRGSTMLSNDKTGWDLGQRILLIQNMVELGNLDEASSAIEALRKHLERSGRTKPIRERDKLIYLLLRALDKSGFDFNKTACEQKKLILQLSSKNKDLKWEPLSHELMPIQKWVLSKTQELKKTA